LFDLDMMRELMILIEDLQDLLLAILVIADHGVWKQSGVGPLTTTYLQDQIGLGMMMAEGIFLLDPGLLKK